MVLFVWARMGVFGFGEKRVGKLGNQRVGFSCVGRGVGVVSGGLGEDGREVGGSVAEGGVLAVAGGVGGVGVRGVGGGGGGARGRGYGWGRGRVG